MLGWDSLALIAYYLLLGAFFFARYVTDGMQRSSMQEEAFYSVICYMAVGMPLALMVFAKDESFLLYFALAIGALMLLVLINYALRSIFGKDAAAGIQILFLLGSFGIEIFLALPIRAELERLALWYFIGTFVIFCGSMLVGPLLFMVFPTNTEKLFSKAVRGKSQVSLEAWALGIGVLYPIWMIVHHLL